MKTVIFNGVSKPRLVSGSGLGAGQVQVDSFVIPADFNPTANATAMLSTSFLSPSMYIDSYTPSGVPLAGNFRFFCLPSNSTTTTISPTAAQIQFKIISGTAVEFAAARYGWDAGSTDAWTFAPGDTMYIMATNTDLSTCTLNSFHWSITMTYST